MEQPCPSVDTDSIGNENSKVELPKWSVERQQMKKKKKNAGFNLRKSLAWDKIKEEEVVWKAETISEFDSSRNEDNKRNSDQMSNDKEAKEGNRAWEVWREGKTQIRDDGFGKVRKSEKLDKKKSFVVKDTSHRAKENMNQETERRDDSLGNKTQENKKQESHEQERNEEEVVGKAETIDEYGSSRKIQKHEERKSDEKSEKMQKRKQWMIKKPKKETEQGQYCEMFKQKLER